MLGCSTRYRVLGRASAQRPLVIVIEDIHWARSRET